MKQPGNDDDQATQVFLKRVLTISLILGFVLRILTPGWMLIFFFIPLLIIMSLHSSIVNGSIKKIPYTKSPYEYLILLSNLFFFLGCAFQMDAGDAPEYYVPILWRIPIPPDSIWRDIFSAISIGSFAALVLTWILQLTLSQNILKKEERG
jgi:hypothetical protein